MINRRNVDINKHRRTACRQMSPPVIADGKGRKGKSFSNRMGPAVHTVVAINDVCDMTGFDGAIAVKTSCRCGILVESAACV